MIRHKWWGQDMLIQYDYKSNNFRSRADEKIKVLVLHYTVVPLYATLGIFTNNANLAAKDRDKFSDEFKTSDPDFSKMCANEVSAHYVNSENGEIYQLVDTQYAAYHAGISFWDGKKNINNQSIGIENVNLGFKTKDLKFPDERGVIVKGTTELWCPFAAAQIANLVELCKKIIAEHDIEPHNIVAHGDIACGRKVDPGPLFPWQALAAAGVGLWYDIKDSTISENIPANPIAWMQERLANYGYDCEQTGVMDAKTTAVIRAFQMHFRQDNVDGNIDLECMKIIDSLCKKKLQLQQDAGKSSLPCLKAKL